MTFVRSRSLSWLTLLPDNIYIYYYFDLAFVKMIIYNSGTIWVEVVRHFGLAWIDRIGIFQLIPNPTRKINSNLTHFPVGLGSTPFAPLGYPQFMKINLQIRISEYKVFLQQARLSEHKVSTHQATCTVTVHQKPSQSFCAGIHERKSNSKRIEWLSYWGSKYSHHSKGKEPPIFEIKK